MSCDAAGVADKKNRMQAAVRTHPTETNDLEGRTSLSTHTSSFDQIQNRQSIPEWANRKLSSRTVPTLIRPATATWRRFSRFESPATRVCPRGLSVPNWNWHAPPRSSPDAAFDTRVPMVAPAAPALGEGSGKALFWGSIQFGAIASHFAHDTDPLLTDRETLVVLRGRFGYVVSVACSTADSRATRASPRPGFRSGTPGQRSPCGAPSVVCASCDALKG